MKPFDLQAAIAGAKLQTRDGREVKQFTYFETEDKTTYPIVAVVGGRICSYTASGCYNDSNDMESINDLFMGPEKKEYWINIWRGNYGINSSCLPHPSKRIALEVRAKDVEYLGDPVKIWEEEV